MTPVLQSGAIIANGTEAYEIVQCLNGDKGKSTVYHVRCKSGRLRNRDLALKKLSGHLPSLSSIITLHQALYHPNIVSLLSVFATNQEQFFVLELCSIGDLSNFLKSRRHQTLDECELRGVARSLADALSYMRKELIVHVDIKPSNILLTGDYGIKLSNFKSSVRLSGNTHFFEPPFPFISSYAAPEIVNGQPFGFSADVWSLGCVLSYCLTGSPPFEKTRTMPTAFSKHKPEQLPDITSDDLKELITHTIQFIPEDRIHVHDILFHPFLASDNLVKSLRPAPVLIGPLRKHYGEVSKPFGGHPHVEKSIPAFFPSKPTRHTSDHLPQTAYGRERLPFADIRNTHPKHLKPFSEKLVNTTRRVVSDPAASALQLFCETHTSNDLANVDAFSRMPNIKSDSVSDPDAVAEVSTSKPNQDPLLEQFQPADINQSDVPTLPIGTERPRPLNTLSMNCQTHKTIYGQITVLSSQSLLVDFRENERRKGLKGDEVLVIEPDGLKVSVYSAPHLSSPSCLVEPTQQFTLQLLPSVYWKQYNDAARLVDQIKRRTPSLVVYLATTKCTLMANAPQGDIELLVTSSTLSNKMQNSDVSFNLRIRFSRQDHSLEIARHLCNDQGEEWKKRTISSISQTPYVSSKDWKMLSSDEKEALRHLTRFAQICDETEELMKKISSNPEGTTKQTHESRQPQPSPPTHSTTATLTNSFSLLNIAPRPHKLSHSARTVPNSDLTLNLGTVGQVSKAECVVSDTKLSMWQDNNNSSLAGRGLQTRFIPSVGWCIRYPSQVSQGGRYRLMFFDGVALDIDVDEDWVELKRQNGEPILYSVRECALKPNLGERMKVFEEFVSLFDDEEEG